MHFFENNYKSFGKICYLCELNCLIMKRFFAIILLFSIVAVLFSSCERNCYCKNLRTGDESIYYGTYSRKECRDAEEYLNEMNHDESYECTYK